MTHQGQGWLSHSSNTMEKLVRGLMWQDIIMLRAWAWRCFSVSSKFLKFPIPFTLCKMRMAASQCQRRAVCVAQGVLRTLPGTLYIPCLMLLVFIVLKVLVLLIV